MATEKFRAQLEKPITNEELNERMFKMLMKRAILSAKFQEKYGHRSSAVANGQAVPSVAVTTFKK